MKESQTHRAITHAVRASDLVMWRWLVKWSWLLICGLVVLLCCSPSMASLPWRRLAFVLCMASSYTTFQLKPNVRSLLTAVDREGRGVKFIEVVLCIGRTWLFVLAHDAGCRASRVSSPTIRCASRRSSSPSVAASRQSFSCRRRPANMLYFPNFQKTRKWVSLHSSTPSATLW